MSDPSLIPEPGDLAKVGGGLGAGGLFTLLLSRIFGGQDKVLGRIDALQITMGTTAEKVALMAQSLERVNEDKAEAREEAKQLRELVSKQGERITRLEAKLEQLSEGGA